MEGVAAGPSDDIFSLSDEMLSDKLQFVEEVGFGNWGSVWLAHPRNNNDKVAVKLVHRSKTSTTAARVKSLWNEMKIVRTFKTDPHPSIVPFYSFIITPSYALITMAYLPTLVPVEVSEHKARPWFHSLLSGIAFLHARGVVHNDIKPANILLSPSNVPVLVDFGFAEKYDLSSPKAFHSNLSYGTPEYLSPERARGLPHDTRKSDVWSLGVTFFEILAGRTPFEHSDGEQFTTKDDLERYWNRTLKGKWVGTWSFSAPIETLLRRMILPNADLRCTAADAMADAYWHASPAQGHKRTASTNTSLDLSRITEETPSKSTSAVKGKENMSPSPVSPPGLGLKARPLSPKSTNSLRVKASASQGKLQPKKRVPVPPLPGDLSPIEGSPNTNTMTHSRSKPALKEKNSAAGPLKPRASNVSSRAKDAKEKEPHYRKVRDGNLPPTPPVERAAAVKRHPNPHALPTPPASRQGHKRELSAAGALAATAKMKEERRRSFGRAGPAAKKDGSGAGSVNARERVREWEREKERLREMARLEEVEREREEEREEEVRMRERMRRAREARERAGPSQVPLTRQEESDEEKEGEAKEEDDAPSVTVEPKEKPGETGMSYFPPAPVATTHARDISVPNLSGWEQEGEMLRRMELLQQTPRSQAPSSMRVVSSPDLVNRAERKSGSPGPYLSFRHSVRKSIDKGINFYKKYSSSAATGHAARSFSIDGFDSPPSNDNLLNIGELGEESRRASWEDSLAIAADSSLPVVQQALRTERVRQDNAQDRMSMWLRNVERVVDETKATFASRAAQGNNAEEVMPALPAPPSVLSRSTSSQNANVSGNRSARSSGRVPRRILAANRIFGPDGTTPTELEEGGGEGNQTFSSFVTSVYPASSPFEMATTTSPTRPTFANLASASAVERQEQEHGTEGTGMVQKRKTLSSGALDSMVRASRVGTGIPEESVEYDEDADDEPSKKREKSKSASNLLDRHIVPRKELDLALTRGGFVDEPPRSPVSPTFMPVQQQLQTPPRVVVESSSFEDELGSSPLHVEPYPQRRVSGLIVPDTPQQKKVEGVYDRFLMATSGVKRVGKGYQSDNAAPVQHHLGPPGRKSEDVLASNSKKENAGVVQQRPFHSVRVQRRKMPPPVSSEDLLRFGAFASPGGGAVENGVGTGPGTDELGVMTYAGPVLGDKTNVNRDTTLMKRAFKALGVPGKTVTRRLSRIG